MKNTVYKGWIFIVTFAIIIVYNSCDDSAVANLQVSTISLDDTTLSETDELAYENIDDEAKNSLIFMREEEKLAHDVYIYMFDLWGLNTFNNISKSETVHTNAVKGLLDYYSIEDPALSQTGAFANEDLQQMYNTLINQGKNSLIDGLIVGATIEEVDIVDLDDAMESCTIDTIVTVYKRLRTGSTYHLKAFVSQLALNGISYAPQYLTQEEFDAIIFN